MRSIYRGLLLIAALTGLASVAQAQSARPVVVFAAASLQTALGKIAADWKATTGKSLTLSYAASSALARQLDNGAPADLFASADLAWMDWAQERKLIKSETRRSLLGNELVLITHRDTPLELKIAPNFALAAAVGDSRLATGNPGSVPVGRYAQAALTSLGVWSDVAPRVAGADSVTAALALVARGEAKLGIVYRTDAASEPKVRVIDAFPAGSHPPITYPFAITASSTNPDALAFLDYLSSPTAARIFQTEGFRLATVGRR